MNEQGGNIIFLVCKPCCDANEKDYGVKIAERSRIGFFQSRTPEDVLSKWLMKHYRCGGRDVDHFKLGYLHEHNHDQAKLKVKNDVAKALQ